jgi:hypothetical protein
LMTAACFTGKFPRLVFVHSYTPSGNDRIPASQITACLTTFKRAIGVS